MPRVLLLLPTTSYRTADFMEAARKLGVEVVVGSDLPQVLAAHTPGRTLTLDFGDSEGAAREVSLFSRTYPLDAVIPVDDDAALVGARASRALGLRHNPVEAVTAARDKHRFRQRLAEAGIPSPGFELFSVRDDPLEAVADIAYPCVIKPVFLSASRGVIRADGPEAFVEAFLRVKALLEDPEVASRGREAATKILVEDYLPGPEAALEGVLTGGRLRVLALFDKPDPLEGPFFEETIYVTPSRLPAESREAVFDCAARTAEAIGLREGPVHAEFRINGRGVWPIEIAARSIGGLCARTLRFGTGLSLEELILRNALGMETESLEQEGRAAGVMMIPIPRAGRLDEVLGMEEARAVPGVEDAVIMIPAGQTVRPLPEGTKYLGFLFARADAPAEVEAALRAAHGRLDIRITPVRESAD
ncbi:MAG: ATP-grasp domain-containing protein [Nitrospinota bacterium]|jgi:biotin carboxylase|nr:ATP-grasp domain-containing protein [Nitrospinota bacterium]HJM43800.1 ATP-grasp domain-containing protein [Nitrospinota bacterium]